MSGELPRNTQVVVGFGKRYIKLAIEGHKFLSNNVSLHPQECAATVMAEHESTVLYKSTDNVMKCGTFEKLCMKVVPREMVPVLSQQLLYTGQLARAHTEHGHEVIKLSTTLERGLTVTDLDIGIVRFIRPSLCTL